MLLYSDFIYKSLEEEKQGVSLKKFQKENKYCNYVDYSAVKTKNTATYDHISY